MTMNGMLRLFCMQTLLSGLVMVTELDGAPEQPGLDAASVSRLLTVSGVPNDDGQLRWPIGLTILAAPGTDRLREQINALFDEEARQAATGPVNPALAEGTRAAVKQLRKLLLKDKADRFVMPGAVYQESERFLNQLDRAEKFLRTGLAAPGGQVGSRE
jgi:hypothetical protein